MRNGLEVSGGQAEERGGVVQGLPALCQVSLMHTVGSLVYPGCRPSPPGMCHRGGKPAAGDRTHRRKQDRMLDAEQAHRVILRRRVMCTPSRGTSSS
jgi:hypothetical protein